MDRWDIFCRVVDNYGDAAFGWRLANALASEHGIAVRLWIDDLATLARLDPAVDPACAQQEVGRIGIVRWTSKADFGAPADVVIDAFGCGIPEAYALAMAERSPRSLWIVTEYLSAEPWVASHHGKPSPHPRLPLERYFFFPGFVPGTGGLLRERGYRARKAAFSADRLWPALGIEPPREQALRISLFAYENPALDSLLDTWRGAASPVDLIVPSGRIASAVGAWLGVSSSAGRHDRDAMRVSFAPFMPQARYDELLWACHWNFVRGEDSFLRAQWAERPFCWHIYPQAGAAHWKKLESFLDLYCAGLAPALGVPLAALMRSWNQAGGGDARALAAAWQPLIEPGALDVLTGHARAWAGRLPAAGEFATRLVEFCAEALAKDRLK